MGDSCSHSFHPSLLTCFQKRKAETEPSEEEGDASEDAPEDVKEVKKEEQQEEVQSSPAEPQQKPDVTQSGVQPRRPKAANPYGSWERVKVEKDP